MTNENKADTHSTTQQPKKYRVIADHQALYPDPLSVEAGELLIISEKVDYWNDNLNWVWIWCTDARGKTGWVPADHITES